MTNHKIIAQPWQINAAAKGALGAIILPFGQYCEDQRSIIEDCRSGKACRDGDGNWIFWCPGNNAELEYLTLKNYPMGSGKGFRIPFKEGDRIYLAEKWVQVYQNSYPDYIDWAREVYVSKDLYLASGGSEDDDDLEECWQPAKTMPPEAAQYWFEVTEVKVTQAKYLNYFAIGKTGFYTSYPDATYPSEEFKNTWDKAYPEHSWSGNLWVIVLEVRAVNQ
jgi:hypothetical protein